ncbi:MAG: hypothetical protein ACLGIO_10850 [Acidimicrobiia bacterium]
MTGEGAVGVAGDDRLLAPTWWTAVCIVPVLVAAWVVLFLFPSRTDQLWAWPVAPEMTALVMGGGYLAGAYFFVRVARDRRWHEVAVGFLAITVFTTVLLAATVLHWDRFNHDHVSFWAWLALYVVTPPLLPLLWRENRRTDPGVASPGDVRVPARLRQVVAVGGSLQLSFAALMFLAPEATAERWPWAATPLTVRTLSAFVAFPAVAWLCFWFEERWSALRVPMQTATIGLVLIGVGALRATDDFDGPSWSVRLFPVALVATVALLVALQVAMERLRPPDRSAR